MIYLDTSMVLARLFAEVRAPFGAFWRREFVSSRPLEFEVFKLDALHPATMLFLRGRGLAPSLATYDQRFAAAAVGEGFMLADC